MLIDLKRREIIEKKREPRKRGADEESVTSAIKCKKVCDKLLIKRLIIRLTI